MEQQENSKGFYNILLKCYNADHLEKNNVTPTNIHMLGDEGEISPPQYVVHRFDGTTAKLGTITKFK